MTKGGLPAPSPGATGLRAAHTREGCDSRSEHSKPGPWGWCRAGDRKQRETPPSPAQWPSRGRGRPAAPGRLPCLAEKAERTEEPGGGTARTAQPRQSQPDGGRRDGMARPGADLASRGCSAGLPAPGGDPPLDPAFLPLATAAWTSAQARALVRAWVSAARGTCSVGQPRFASHLCSQVVPRTPARADTCLLPGHGLLSKPPSKSWTHLQPLLTGATDTQGRPAPTPPVHSPSAQLHGVPEAVTAALVSWL